MRLRFTLGRCTLIKASHTIEKDPFDSAFRVRKITNQVRSPLVYAGIILAAKFCCFHGECQAALPFYNARHKAVLFLRSFSCIVDV